MDPDQDLVRRRCSPTAQRRILAVVLRGLRDAPLYVPTTPGGRMSVLQSNFGDLGWVSDAKGYRYAPAHPLTGRPWPAMPAVLARLWRALHPEAPPPDSCLINLYGPRAKMGLHRDVDEADFSAPVVSVSLGDDAVFRLGGPRRTDPVREARLQSGDVLSLCGDLRLAYHGIARIRPGTSDLIPGGGRLNLTLRRAAPVCRS